MFGGGDYGGGYRAPGGFGRRTDNVSKPDGPYSPSPHLQEVTNSIKKINDHTSNMKEEAFDNFQNMVNLGLKNLQMICTELNHPQPPEVSKIIIASACSSSEKQDLVREHAISLSKSKARAADGVWMRCVLEENKMPTRDNPSDDSEE